MIRWKLFKLVSYGVDLHEWNDLWKSEQVTFSLRLVLGNAEVKQQLTAMNASIQGGRVYHPGEQVFILLVTTMRCLIHRSHSIVSSEKVTSTFLESGQCTDPN